jgi:superfamily II DNA or RNA helicase
MDSHLVEKLTVSNNTIAGSKLSAGTYRVPLDLLSPAQVEHHIKNMTFVPKSTGIRLGEQREPVVAAYIENADLVLPRAYGFAKFGIPSLGWCEEDFPNNARIPPKFNGVLRPEHQQQQAVDCAISQMRKEGGSTIVVPCGFGKTTMALYIASRVRGRILILVHKSVLLTQWEERIAQFLPTAKVGVLRGDRMEADETRDIVVGMLQSVYKREAEYEEMLSGFKLLIVDEAHRVPAATFFSAVKSVSSQYTLGLTATPNRKDGMTGLLYAVLGSVAFQAERPPCVLAHACVRSIPCSPNIKEAQLYGRNTINFSKLITDLSKDKLRTRRIVEDIAHILLSPRYIIVLADRTAMLKDICAQLLDEGIPALQDDPHGGARVVIGSTKPSERDDALNARVVLSTYSLAAEGLDRARLDTLVLATPKGDIVQSVGRVLRLHPEKQPPLVLDYIESVPSGVLMGLQTKRNRILLDHGFEITDTFEFALSC